MRYENDTVYRVYSTGWYLTGGTTERGMNVEENVGQRCGIKCLHTELCLKTRNL